MANEDAQRVIVVGAGNAALVSALAAHQAGADVIVLEAAGYEERGGNSRFSGAIFRFAHDGLESILPLLTEAARGEADRAQVAPYPTEDYLADCLAMSSGRADPDLTRLLVEHSYETVRWLRDAGVKFELTTEKFIDAEVLASGEKFTLTPGGALRAVDEGVGLVQNLFDAVEAAGIEVRYDAPVHRLITSGSTVVGVQVRHGDFDEEIRGVVVLACGGFEANPEARMRYLGAGWDLVKVRGTRFNMGNVLFETLDAGAAPAGHWGGCHASPQDFHAPPTGDLALTDKMCRYSYPYGILVNVHGERFIDEGEEQYLKTYAKTGAAINAQPQARAVQIFDQKTLHLLEPRYSTGTPISADTIAELATLVGIDPAALERTVEEFNAATPAGEFDPFMKDGLATDERVVPRKSNWALPIDKPPFVAYEVVCGITFTYGGLKVDTESRVLNRQGRPMPGLYATGEIAGGFFYHNYAGGSGLMRGAVCGRIAGTNAARDAAGRT
jgi:tricarballylate dehydrogenase